jgi:hypothetical protein
MFRRSAIQWRNRGGIGEGARVTSPRREIRRMSPKQAHTVALRCPDDCVKRAHVRISRGSPENAALTDRRRCTAAPMRGLWKRFRRRDHLFWPGANAQIFGQIHPAHRSRSIKEELGRACYIVAMNSRTCMQHAIALDDFRVGIGKKSIAVAAPLAEPARYFGSVDADRNRANAKCFECLQILFNTPQLGVAEGSSVAAVENQQHAPGCVRGA